MRVFNEMRGRSYLKHRMGGTLSVALALVGGAGCLQVALNGGVLAAQEVDPEVFVREDAGASAIEHATENIVAIMASGEVDLTALVRRVLAEGTGEGRERFFAALALYNNLLSGIPPERSEMMAADTGAWGGLEELRNMFGEEPSRADLARMGVAYGRNIRSLGEEIPRIVEEEYRRQQEGAPSASDTRVFGLLFGVAQYFEQLGSVEARDAAFGAWMEVESAEEAFFRELRVQDRDRLEAIPGGLAAVGRGVPLFFLLRQVPQDAQPLVGRRLNPRLRWVAHDLLRQGGPELSAEELREMQLQAGGMLALHEDAWSMMTVVGAAWLLAAERPLAEGSAQSVYEFGCGSADRGCAMLVALLYSGPDDPSLASIQPRLERTIAQWLFDSSAARREMCKRRLSGTGAVVGPLPVDGSVRREREELDSETRTETGRIQAALDLVELIDLPARILLDAVFEYWAEERDPKAQEILVRAGMLGASALPDSAALPALGDCLAEDEIACFFIERSRGRYAAPSTP